MQAAALKEEKTKRQGRRDRTQRMTLLEVTGSTCRDNGQQSEKGMMAMALDTDRLRQWPQTDSGNGQGQTQATATDRLRRRTQTDLDNGLGHRHTHLAGVLASKEHTPLNRQCQVIIRFGVGKQPHK